MNTLNRRQFLKLGSLVLGSGAFLATPTVFEHVVRLFVDPQIRFGRNLIHGTAQGNILSSGDEGRTWNKLVGFGEHYCILQLVQQGDEIYANVSFGSHGFWLRSTDGQNWFVV